PTTIASSPLSLHDALPISFDPRARLWGGAGADRPRGAGGAGPPPAARAIHGGHVGHLSLTRCSSRVTCCSSRGHARLGCPHGPRSEEHTSELQSRFDLVCR